ncbi:MAG: hypothetical protein U9R50_02270 [Campylobacterota bacterium]|nr:hypothetical protein [Campylobacterota bacterium]
MPRHSSHQHATNALEKIEMAYLSEYRVGRCNNYERFCASLIRASMMQYATIIIISPLQQFFSKDPVETLFKLIHKLRLEQRVKIFDLSLYENDYTHKGVLCPIIE